MVLDKLNLFCREQAVTVSAPSTDVVDLVKGGDAYGNELFFVVNVAEAAAASGAATVVFSLETSDAEAFGTKTTLHASGEVGKAVLVKGATPVRVRVPQGVKRYLRAFFTVGTGPLTAGKFTAFLTPDAQTNG